MILKCKTIAAAAILAVALAGCSKKSEETSAETVEPGAGAAAVAAVPRAPGAEVLPGAGSVRSAVEKKDYRTAVGALLVLKSAAVTPPQLEEYMRLYDEVKFALIDASASDPKANEALMTLRASTAGR